MVIDEKIDNFEKNIFKDHPYYLDLLLFDNTTKNNIKWCTNNYKNHGEGYFSNCSINKELITGRHSGVIKPRIYKSKSEKIKRSKVMAEVFTPSWICNKQNNEVDKIWFGFDSPFNYELLNSWEVNNEKIPFKGLKTWESYIADIRLEIACGEAPYLVSRYDTVTGVYIPVSNRIGLLDRKFRVISENCNTKEEWIRNSFIAIKSIYGFEYQGDNLFIARRNVFFSFIEFFYDLFSDFPSEEEIIEVLKIISWNLWQMDAIKMVVPNSCHDEKTVQLSLFGDEKANMCRGCITGNPKEHNGTRCMIMDWEKNKKIRFVSLLGWR